MQITKRKQSQTENTTYCDSNYMAFWVKAKLWRTLKRSMAVRG